jgi:hypothetical protein
MGQYWYLVNLTKQEFVHPHTLGAGLKLWEQLATHPGTCAAAVILCASHHHKRGGGDLKADNSVAGRWAGDRIAWIGDYAAPNDLESIGIDASEIYRLCVRNDFNLEEMQQKFPQEWGNVTEDMLYKDISDMVAEYIEDALNGKFIGHMHGWKNFVHNIDQSLWRNSVPLANRMEVQFRKKANGNMLLKNTFVGHNSEVHLMLDELVTLYQAIGDYLEDVLPDIVAKRMKNVA